MRYHCSVVGVLVFGFVTRCNGLILASSGFPLQLLLLILCRGAFTPRNHTLEVRPGRIT